MLIYLLACGDELKDSYVEDSVVLEDQDGDGFLNDEDCDDGDSSIYPQAQEVCDGIDNNCNNQADEGVTSTFYADSDQDGFGSNGIVLEACSATAGYVANGSDCDDTDASVFPGAPEQCDEQDNDCDDEIDEGIGSEYFIDSDGDGFGIDDQTLEACDLRDGLAAIAGDCNDMDAAQNPLEEELCDGIDNNCDGQVDEGVTLTFYLDWDADGYGDSQQTIEACGLIEGYVDNSLDCDDSDSFISPEALEYCDDVDNDCDGSIDEEAQDAPFWYADADGDGHGSSETSQQSCTQPPFYVSSDADCNDGDDDVSASALEICDGIDNNCDGQVDEDGALNAPAFYEDSDHDDYGDPASFVYACAAPDGFVDNDQDCDDDNNTIKPIALEVCDGVDNNCNGIDDEEAIDLVVAYIDLDQDGYGDEEVELCAQDMSDEHVLQGGDCDEEDVTISPEALEYCDDVDNDCDGSIDEEAQDAPFWYADADGDGHGSSETSQQSCTQPPFYVSSDADCNDGDDDVSASALEICDEIDNNCDGQVDEDGALNAPVFYEDSDHDDYGDPTSFVYACATPDGFVDNDQDCDDDNNNVAPDAQEFCDELDNDCDQLVDEDVSIDLFQDLDGDGYGDEDVAITSCFLEEGYVLNALDCDDDSLLISPVGIELCNETDDNCDGEIDNLAENESSEGVLYFQDLDGDGYGDVELGRRFCNEPLEGYGLNNSDCDDSNSDLGLCLDCVGIAQSGQGQSSGIYTIDPLQDGVGFQAYCDMETDGGGWTLVGRQIPSDKFTQTSEDINMGEDWDVEGTFRLGNEKIQAISPTLAWRIFSKSLSTGVLIDDAWFVPECVIDWDTYVGTYSEAPEATSFYPDCGIAYTDSSFQDIVGGVYTQSNCSLGIGQNNSGGYCSIRMSSCTWSTVTQQGQAAPCDINNQGSVIMELWVK